MNILHDISPERICPDDFVAVVEIEKNGTNKYELDKETGMLVLDRILYTSTHYPANYGFIPRTFADDCDPLDVFIYCSRAIQPLSLVRCYAIGSVDMLDSGKVDTKIIAVPYNDPTFNSYKDISDMPPHIINELIHFLKVYKELEGKQTVIGDFHAADEARASIAEAIAYYNSQPKD